MAKVNISISDKLLYHIDSMATRREMSRSGFIQEASARYVAELEAEEERLRRQKSVETAMEKARSLAGAVGSFDGAAQIRKDRRRRPRR